MEIAGALAALKAAIDGGRALYDTSKAWSEADLKLRIADLINALTDARVTISDLHEELRQRERELQEERDRRRQIDELAFEAPFYWRLSEGKRDGPFCQRCRDADSKAVRLIDWKRGRWKCAACDTFYEGPDRARFEAEDSARLRESPGSYL